MKKSLYAIMSMSKDRLVKKQLYTKSEVHDFLDTAHLEGKKYYAIELKGLARLLTEKEVQPLQNLVEKGTGLSIDDLKQLNRLLRVLKTKPAREGMIIAYQMDTYLREKIPSSIWKKMGGEIL